MFTINFRQVLTSLFVALLIGCMFSNGVLAQEGKIAASVLIAAQKQEMVPVMIRLQDQSGHEIGLAVQSQFTPILDGISDRIEDKIRPFHEQRRPLPPNVEQEIKALHEELEAINQQMQNEIYTQIWNRISGAQQRVREAIENAGGKVGAQIVALNAIGASLPAKAVNAVALLPEISSVELDATEKGKELDVSVPTMGSSRFWNAGFTGGVYDVGIMDDPPDVTHPALSSHWMWTEF